MQTLKTMAQSRKSHKRGEKPEAVCTGFRCKGNYGFHVDRRQRGPGLALGCTRLDVRIAKTIWLGCKLYNSGSAKYKSPEKSLDWNRNFNLGFEGLEHC